MALDVQLALDRTADAFSVRGKIEGLVPRASTDFLVVCRAAAACSLFQLLKVGGSRHELQEVLCRLEVLTADATCDQLERARAAIVIGHGWRSLGRKDAGLAWMNSAAVMFDRIGHRHWARSAFPATVFPEVRVPTTDGTLTSGTNAGAAVKLKPDLNGVPDERPQWLATDAWQGLLTPAELRVALRIGGGRSNREVAEALGVSVKTVESHVQSVYRKLGFRRRAELAHLVGRMVVA